MSQAACQWHATCEPLHQRGWGRSQWTNGQAQPGGRCSPEELGASTFALGSGAGARSARAKELVIGFIYVGAKDDYGYNQAHAEGAAS